jgi:hypothetical protein
MIKQHGCFTAHCDDCGNSYENGDGVTLHYDSAEEAIDEAEGNDWVMLSDGRLVCYGCVSDLIARSVIERNDSDDPDAPAYRLVNQIAPAETEPGR